MSASVATTNATDVANPAKCNTDNSSVIMNFQNSDSTKDDNKTVDICITTSEAAATPAQQHVAPKAQVVPLVYIQTPPKLNLPYASANKTNTNNVIVNTVAPFHVANIGSKPSNLAIPATIVNSQGVIFGSSVKTQQIVIQKSNTGSVQAVVPSNYAQKRPGAYLTMLKPVQKPADRLQVTPLNKLQSTDNLHHIISSSSIGTTLNLQNHKYVLAPMPTVTTNRLPVTATTNSVQPKSIAFMPLIPVNSGLKQKVFNLKISDGQLQNESQPLAQGCQSEKGDIGSKLACEEVVDLESPDGNCDKSYELSIVEEPLGTKMNNNNELGITISIPEKVGERKDQQKQPKHGVSILKKSYAFSESRRQEKSSLIISPVPNSITTISDVTTKEVKISTDLDDEPVIVSEARSAPQRTERRRKSNVSYRREFENVEITSDTWEAKRPRRSSFEPAEITFTKLTDSEGSDNNADTKDAPEDMIEIEVIKQNADVNMNEDYDVSKVLSWEDGIGSLPGSDLKFQMNEFGLLEYITKDEYQNIVSKRVAKAKELKKEGFQEDVQCVSCGCYGILSDFISPKYCSPDCQDSANKAAKETKIKKRKRRFYKRNSDLFGDKPEREPSGSEEDDTSNENSQDKFSYPWTCTKKGFSWSKYLDHMKAKSAPVKLFKDPFPYNRNGFRPGMKLEGVDPQHPSYFCVLTVAEVIGYRLRLHFDGYPENYDFWVNADSTDIFPAGWCEKYGHVLHPPPGYTVEDFNWNTYLKHTKATAAPKHLFVNRAGNVRFWVF